MRRRKKPPTNKKYLIPVLIFLGLAGLLFGVKNRLRPAWAGREQVSFGFSKNNGQILILTLTPAKNMVTVTNIPANLVIQTPWFGNYTADKLNLLVEQEKEENIFNRSLSYYFGVPVDFGFRRVDVDDFPGFFFPPKNLTFWRAWRYLTKKDLVWKNIDLTNYSQTSFLADGSQVFLLDSEKVGQQLRSYFSDPVIANEGLTVSVFNAGGKSGIARKISNLCQNMGLRVIEVSDSKDEVENCVIYVDEEEVLNSLTINRLTRVIGCQAEIGANHAISDINIVIKNVKID